MSQSAEAMPTRVEKRRFGEGGKAYSETLFGDFPRYLNKSDAYHPGGSNFRRDVTDVGATLVVALLPTDDENSKKVPA
jgi:hypothetical protein